MIEPIVGSPATPKLRVGGRVTRALENRVPPPFLVIVVAAIMATALLSHMAAPLPTTWRWGLAATFFLCAGLFGFPAFVAFGRAETTIDPVRVDRASALVTTGIYRFTRNPMYVALALLLCAWAGWIGHAWPWLGPVAFVLFVTRFQIVPEERALAVTFGDAYAAYRRSVRRWL
jgi:protein-S-isoprenylcysteine O-methyltransferase Ste14